MSITQFIAVTILSTVLAVALIAGLSRIGAAHAAGFGPISGMAHFGGHRAGWMAHRGRGGLEHLCGERRDERLTTGIAFIESFVEFTPEQTPAWNKLVAALREGSDTIGKACQDLTADPAASAPRRLARVEILLNTGLELVRKVRPAFDEFFAVLTPEQQNAIDEMIARRHSR